MTESHFPEWAHAIFGAAGLSILGVALGRLAWHAEEVRAERRDLFSVHLLLELPVIGAMAFLTWGAAAYFELGVEGVAIIGPTLGWLGPRGTQWVVARLWAWWSRRAAPADLPKGD